MGTRLQHLRWFRSPGAASVVAVVVFCIVTTSTLVASQGIEAIPPKIYAKLPSSNVPLLCRSNKPATSCSVRIPGYSSTYDVHALPNGIEYYGDSLQRGECGILFSSLRSTNLGKFQCNMTIGGEVFEQSIVIEAALSPEPTDLSIGEDTIVEQGAFAPNQTLRVTCSSRNANPASNLTWLLDEDPIDPSYLGPVETSENVDSKGRNLVSVSQQLNYYITLKDHGRKIVCRAEHFAIQKGFFRGFLPLNFRFIPEPTPTINIGETFINVTIKAHPRPATSWTINDMTIAEGQSLGAYRAYYPKDLGFGNYLVLLRINDDQGNRTDTITMTASNELGTRDYVIRAQEIEPTAPGRGNRVFFLISLWTYVCSVIVTCVLRRMP